MTTQTLSRISLETVDNCRVAATQTLVAYRLGSHRVVGVVDGTLKDSVYARTVKLAPRTTQRLNGVRGTVVEIVGKGIDRVAERTEQAIGLTSRTAAAQLSKVAEFAGGVDNRIVASGIQAAARLTMPGAKVALAVSSKVAEAASALAEAAGARPVRKAVRKGAAASKREVAPVARNAKATVKTAARRVAKVAKSVEAPVEKVQRAARAARKSVVEAVAA